MTTSQISKAINGKVYSFHGRYYSIEQAIEVCKQIINSNHRHCYYIRITSKKDGISYDVRKEN